MKSKFRIWTVEEWLEELKDYSTKELLKLQPRKSLFWEQDYLNCYDAIEKILIERGII